MQEKTKPRISMSSYRGVGDGLFKINEPIADKFMDAADLRSNIFIVQKPQQRARTYLGTGDTMTFNRRKMKEPTINPDKVVQVVGEGGDWLVMLDDQRMADAAARKNDGTKKLEDLIFPDFKTNVKAGLTSALIKEKALNGENYNTIFWYSWGIQAIHAANIFIPRIEVNVPYFNIPEMSGVAGGVEHAALVLLSNTIVNSTLKMSDYLHYLEKVRGIKSEDSYMPNSFVKKSAKEWVFPAVPVHRLARGYAYLNGKGRNIVTKD